MDELARRLAASRDRLRDRITAPPVEHIITRARRRRTQRRAQIAVAGLVAVLAVAVPVASLVGGQHRAEPAGPPPPRPAITVPTTVTVTHTPSPSATAPSPQESTPGPHPTSSGVPSTGESSAAITAPTTIQTGQPILGISAGYELFARSPESVARIQFAQGRVTVTPTPPIRSGAGAFFLVGTHAVMARAWDRVPGFLLPDDGPATDLPGALSGGGSTLPGPEPGQVWVREKADGAGSGADTLLRLVGFDGTATTSFPMSGSPLAPDGNGYVLVRGADCLYDVHPDGRTCIASGKALDLVAVGPTGWVLHPCADDARCTDVYIERATGTRHQLSVRIDPQQWGVISPDGSYAAILEPGAEDTDAGTLHLIDLSTGTGRTVTVAPNAAMRLPSYGSALAWSPDGQWLFVAAGPLLAVDPATGHSRTLTDVPGTPDFLQVGIRPAPTGDGQP